MKKHLLTIAFFLSVTTLSFGQATQLASQASVAARMAADFSTLGIGQDDGTSVVFYPNPVKSTLNIKFPQRGEYTVRIYNIVGEKIAEKSIINDDLVKINLSDLQNGMYFLSYELNGKVVTKTFSKTQ